MKKVNLVVEVDESSNLDQFFPDFLEKLTRVRRDFCRGFFPAKGSLKSEYEVQRFIAK
jgi:hypothetical protein